MTNLRGIPESRDEVAQRYTRLSNSIYRLVPSFGNRYTRLDAATRVDWGSDRQRGDEGAGEELLTPVQTRLIASLQTPNLKK
ncbi:MAG: hypothetical protein V7L04_00600 [Nostoc sp.]|uniref:hypothetical protein n=1 Tax=Nostoc sp. TaxID=1180 RepID=UPI002FF48C05